MTNQPPKTTFAFAGELRDYVVRLAGARCMSCGREAQASDIEIRPDGIFWICQGCHEDRMSITSS